MRLVFAILVSLSFTSVAFAGDHPHPTKEAEKAAAKDHKDHNHGEEDAQTAAQGGEGKKMKAKKSKGKAKQQNKKEEEKVEGDTSWNAEQVEQDLISFVNGKSSEGGGRFSVTDELLNQTRQLKLKKIHTEKIMEMRDGTSFVCADFTDANGETVDVDFFMQPNPAGAVDQVTQVQIHKVNGKQRFTYILEDGKWLQKAVN